MTEFTHSPMSEIGRYTVGSSVLITSPYAVSETSEHKTMRYCTAASENVLAVSILHTELLSASVGKSFKPSQA